MPSDQIHIVNAFMNGVIFMGFMVSGLFFLRFWTRVRDRLFLLFAVAFWTLGAIRMGMVVLLQPEEEHHLYWFRLAAYLLILLAIVDKNKRK